MRRHEVSDDIYYKVPLSVKVAFSCRTRLERVCKSLGILQTGKLTLMHHMARERGRQAGPGGVPQGARRVICCGPAVSLAGLTSRKLRSTSRLPISGPTPTPRQIDYGFAFTDPQRLFVTFFSGGSLIVSSFVTFLRDTLFMGSVNLGRPLFFTRLTNYSDFGARLGRFSGISANCTGWPVCVSLYFIFGDVKSLR